VVSTAVQPRTPPFEQVAVLRTYWSLESLEVV
jgi:hypothetical protein